MARSPGATGLRRACLVACGVAIEVWALAAVQEPPGSNIPRHVALSLAAWLCYAAALRIVLGLPPSRCGRDLALIFGVAGIVRLTLLFTEPSLSDDIYRAVWDARLVHAGVNPYAHAPSAPEVAAYRDLVIWPRVNHPDQRTPYPPLAEVLGAAAYTAMPERLLAMQGLAAAADLLSAGLLAWLLQRSRADPRRSLAVAWSPIGALHFAHSGHNDASMIAAVVAAALLLTFGRRWLALAALGAATAVKGIPVLMVPAFARASGRLPILAWAGTLAVATLPFLGAGSGLLAGVLEEAGDQRFNESFHLVAERIIRLLIPEHAGAAASTLGFALVAGAAVATGLKGTRTAAGALVRGSRVLGVYVLVAAVVEPWYLTWLAPLIALQIRPGAGRAPFAFNDAPAWLWLGGAATLTDLTYLPNGSRFWIPIRLVEYLPAYAILAVALARWWRRRRSPDPAQPK